MSSVYYDGLEEMLADQRDYERELAAERLERLERADNFTPGMWFGASSPANGAGAAGDKSRRVSPTDAIGRPLPPSPVEVPSQGPPRRDVGAEQEEVA